MKVIELLEKAKLKLANMTDEEFAELLKNVDTEYNLEDYQDDSFQIIDVSDI